MVEGLGIGRPGSNVQRCIIPVIRTLHPGPLGQEELKHLESASDGCIVQGQISSCTQNCPCKLAKLAPTRTTVVLDLLLASH